MIKQVTKKKQNFGIILHKIFKINNLLKMQVENLIINCILKTRLKCQKLWNLNKNWNYLKIKKGLKKLFKPKNQNIKILKKWTGLDGKDHILITIC